MTLAWLAWTLQFWLMISMIIFGVHTIAHTYQGIWDWRAGLRYGLTRGAFATAVIIVGSIIYAWSPTLFWLLAAYLTTRAIITHVRRRRRPAVTWTEDNL